MMKRITLLSMVLGAAIAFSSCTPKPQSKTENCFALKAEDFQKTIEDRYRPDR